MSVFADCASMLRAGFTPQEIRMMLKADIQEAEENKKNKEEEETKVFKKEADKTTEKSQDEPDYKALYEKTKKDLDELQSENTKKDIKPASVDREELFKNIKASIS